MWEVILSILGIMCMFYYIILLASVGRYAVFAKFWFMLGIVLVLSCVWLPWLDAAPVVIRILFAAGLVILAALFILVEACIISKMCSTAPENLDYVIVLGARVNGTIPSRSLYRRIDAAEIYLKENPGTKAILSGGQGLHEDITEAEAMYRELTVRGIDSKRMYKEDTSTDTMENMRNSKLFLDCSKNRIAIISSNFHLFRGIALGKKQGYEQLYGIPAKVDGILLANYMVREFFAVVKDKLAGNI